MVLLNADGQKIQKVKTKEELAKEEKNDHRIVKGIFRCFEPMGGGMKFSFKKYRNDKVETYEMVDGQIYDIPLMVAKHLNQNCCWYENKYLLDSNGNPSTSAGRKNQRCSFESLEFNFEDSE